MDEVGLGQGARGRFALLHWLCRFRGIVGRFGVGAYRACIHQGYSTSRFGVGAGVQVRVRCFVRVGLGLGYGYGYRYE